MSSRRPRPASSMPTHGGRAQCIEEDGPMRQDRSEERAGSPCFHSHSEEPALLRLGACWGPSSRGAAISLSVSLLVELVGSAAGGPLEEAQSPRTGR